MNCPSRTDNMDGHDAWNQNPNPLEGTTREDFNRTNSRILRRLDPAGPSDDHAMHEAREAEPRDGKNASWMGVETTASQVNSLAELHVMRGVQYTQEPDFTPSSPARSASFLQKAQRWMKIYGQFIGPGFMISVAYIDPGNYSTDVAAGASYQFKLLFIVLVSNIIAIYLQSLCIKLGTITGMDLAQMCRAHLPRWLNVFLYLMAEGAIIATDIAEVIGTAIAINVLIPQISLVAGCAISILDVFVTLMFYRSNGTMKGVRAFEFFVAALVLGVVICFCILLSLIENISAGEVFRGYLPSSAIVESNGIYQACGILGATVMPHSLYLGSGIVQPRLIDYDEKYGHRIPHTPTASRAPQSSHSAEKPFHRPSLAAIRHCMKYSIIELSISLSTFALFVNSAILIVAGASLYGIDNAQDASLFSIHDLLASSIAPAAGTLFALALLLSGMSAGIVCTIAGQMVSEGALNWTIAPWLRRLITRSIAITPSIIIAGAVGKDGLDAALNGSQVALSVALPFISAPLIYFTSRNKYMTVNGNGSAAIAEDDVDEELEGLLEAEQLADESTKMRNHWTVTAFAVLLWLIVAVMNVANLVLLGLGH